MFSTLTFLRETSLNDASLVFAYSGAKCIEIVFFHRALCRLDALENAALYTPCDVISKLHFFLFPPLVYRCQVSIDPRFRSRALLGEYN